MITFNPFRRCRFLAASFALFAAGAVHADDTISLKPRVPAPQQQKDTAATAKPEAAPDTSTQSPATETGGGSQSDGPESAKMLRFLPIG